MRLRAITESGWAGSRPEDNDDPPDMTYYPPPPPPEPPAALPSPEPPVPKVEPDEPLEPPVDLPQVLRGRIGEWSAGTVIDGGFMERTYPFFYSAEYGLIMGREGTYHGTLFGDGDTPIKQALMNIYYGGDLDGSYRADKTNMKSGIAGRTGFGFKMRANIYPVWVVGFYDNEQTQWCGNAIRELLKAGHITKDTYVARPDEDTPAMTLSEFMQKFPMVPGSTRFTSTRARKNNMPPLPTGPAIKTWQGEMSKIRPGQKWWAPYSEGKDKR